VREGAEQEKDYWGAAPKDAVRAYTFAVHAYAKTNREASMRAGNPPWDEGSPAARPAPEWLSRKEAQQQLLWGILLDGQGPSRLAMIGCPSLWQHEFWEGGGHRSPGAIAVLQARLHGNWGGDHPGYRAQEREPEEEPIYGGAQWPEPAWSCGGTTTYRCEPDQSSISAMFSACENAAQALQTRRPGASTASCKASQAAAAAASAAAAFARAACAAAAIPPPRSPVAGDSAQCRQCTQRFVAMESGQRHAGGLCVWCAGHPSAGPHYQPELDQWKKYLDQWD